MYKNRHIAFALAVNLAIVLLIAAQAVAAERTVVLKVERLTCASSEIQVQTFLHQIPGVSHYVTDQDEHTATVTFDADKVGPDKIKDKLKANGFPVSAESFQDGD